MKRFNVTAVLTANFIVEAKSEEEARMIAFDMPSETEWELTDKNIPTRIYFEVADVPSVRVIGIMDCSNGHDKNLVNRINKAYDEANHYFCTIVQYLIRTQCGEASCDETDMYTACHWYCQEVADNRDLEIILNYCRM